MFGWPKASFGVNRAPSLELNGLVSSSCERLAFPALVSRFTLEFVLICTTRPHYATKQGQVGCEGRVSKISRAPDTVRHKYVGWCRNSLVEVVADSPPQEERPYPPPQPQHHQWQLLRLCLGPRTAVAGARVAAGVGAAGVTYDATCGLGHQLVLR